MLLLTGSAQQWRRKTTTLQRSSNGILSACGCQLMGGLLPAGPHRPCLATAAEAPHRDWSIMQRHARLFLPWMPFEAPPRHMLGSGHAARAGAHDLDVEATMQHVTLQRVAWGLHWY